MIWGLDDTYINVHNQLIAKQQMGASIYMCVRVLCQTSPWLIRHQTRSSCYLSKQGSQLTLKTRYPRLSKVVVLEPDVVIVCSTLPRDTMDRHIVWSGESCRDRLRRGYKSS